MGYRGREAGRKRKIGGVAAGVTKDAKSRREIVRLREKRAGGKEMREVRGEARQAKGTATGQRAGVAVVRGLREGASGDGTSASHGDDPPVGACGEGVTAPDGGGVVGCWARAWKGWKDAGASRELVEWVRDGVPLLVTSPPRSGVMESGVRSHVPFVSGELERLRGAGALEKGEVRLVCPLGSVPKRKGSTRRLIHNLIPLNRHITAPSFHPRTRELVLMAVERGDRMMVRDLKAGYHQVWVREGDRVWLGVLGPGMEAPERWAVLPFGAASAPFLFNRLTGFAAAHLTRRCRAEGASHCTGGVFFDDFVWVFRPWEEGAVRKGVDGGSEMLNLTWGGEEQCGTRVEYIGEVWDTVEWTRSLSAHFQAAFVETVKKLARAVRKGWVPMGLLQRVMGMCSWAAGCDPFFATQRAWLAVAVRSVRRVAVTHVTYHTRRAVAELTRRLADEVKAPLRPPPVRRADWEAWSDASLFGWGVAARPMGQSTGSMRSVTDVIRQLRPMHLNEAEGVHGGLLEWAEEWEGQTVRWGVDNKAVYWAMMKRKCRDPTLLMWVTKVWGLIDKWGLKVEWHWLPSEDNVPADQLSRGVARADWTLSSKLFSTLQDFFGARRLDLFASRFDKKCARFVARWPDPEAVASDAFSLFWSDLPGGTFMCPPWRVVGKALRKLVDEGVPEDCVMVVPWWGEGVRWWTMWAELVDVCVRVEAGPEVAQRVWVGNTAPPPTHNTDLCVAKLRSHPRYGNQFVETGHLRADPQGDWVWKEKITS